MTCLWVFACVCLCCACECVHVHLLPSLLAKGNQFPCRGDLICRSRAQDGFITTQIDHCHTHLRSQTLTHTHTEFVIYMRLNGWSDGKAVALTSRSLWVLVPPTFFVSLILLCHFTSVQSEQQIHISSHLQCLFFWQRSLKLQHYLRVCLCVS